jgi:hypothetical protein
MLVLKRLMSASSCAQGPVAAAIVATLSNSLQPSHLEGFSRTAASLLLLGHTSVFELLFPFILLLTPSCSNPPPPPPVINESHMHSVPPGSETHFKCVCRLIRLNLARLS